MEEVMDYNQYLDRVFGHKKSLPLELDLQHAILGMGSEAGELHDAIKANMIYGKPIDVVNIGEEMGDGLYFGGLFAWLLKFDLNQIAALATDTKLELANPLELIKYSAHALDAAAACGMEVVNHIYDGKPMRLPTTASYIVRYLRNLDRIGQCFNLRLEHAKHGNVAKLDYRYGGGAFDANKGLNRDKAAERLVIAKGLGIQLAQAA
jgi:NTP pyrophosphatase (non-canonical NTP hydrolase)